MSKRADPFEWGGGHPALDFVNTLDERPFDRPIENLATDRDLVRFTQLAGLVEPALARTLRTRAGLASSRVAGARESCGNTSLMYWRRSTSTNRYREATWTQLRPLSGRRAQSAFSWHRPRGVLRSTAGLVR